MIICTRIRLEVDVELPADVDILMLYSLRVCAELTPVGRNVEFFYRATQAHCKGAAEWNMAKDTIDHPLSQPLPRMIGQA
jgi:hypothetical protein